MLKTHRSLGVAVTVLGLVVLTTAVIDSDLSAYIIGSVMLATGIALTVLGKRIDNRYRRRLQGGAQ